MKKILRITFALSFFALIIGVCLFFFFGSSRQHEVVVRAPEAHEWSIRSIDVMKYSRDIAREKLNDTSFDAFIEKQTEQIADTGATHIAIGTPYDEEFYPFLKRWVDAARRHGLHVWFRGNLSGWEEWFGYAPISRAEHIKQVTNFIRSHEDLFQDGDAFSSCPECENGGPGDPRQTGNVEAYRNFLRAEYAAVKKTFDEMGVNVQSNLFSMNGDVARLVMDPATTKALDGVVTIDHYVSTPEKLVADVRDMAKRSGGQVVLGEFGAPIPDIHGDMTEEEQAQWIRSALTELRDVSEFGGVNYWVAMGGSTHLWNDNGSERLAVAAVRDAYTMTTVYGFVLDDIGDPVSGADVALAGDVAQTNAEGYFEVAVHEDVSALSVQKEGYAPQELSIQNGESRLVTVELKPVQSSRWHALKKQVILWRGKFW